MFERKREVANYDDRLQIADTVWTLSVLRIHIRIGSEEQDFVWAMKNLF
jgi:hypothetical protein